MQSAKMKSELFRRLDKKQALVGVVGLGYVGLPLCLAMVKADISIVGFDIDSAKCVALEEGESYLAHILSEDILSAVSSGRFTATDDFSRLSEPDVIIICVPTPLTKNRDPDLSYLTRTAESIAKTLRAGQFIVLESTTYPGTTENVISPILSASGLRPHEDFFLAYSPEREDPGNGEFQTSSIPKVIGADTVFEREITEKLYNGFIEKTVVVSSSKAAELVKLMENIFRSVNIALVNEMKTICDAMDVDIWEVISAASTKPFGFMPFYPGPGLGGHCIPVDPFYLSWKAREYGINAKFIELAGEINSEMPYYVVDKLMLELNNRQQKSLAGSKILILGVAYKKNVDDMRESPALKILRILGERNADVSFYDPHVPFIPQTREYSELAGKTSVAWKPELSGDYDACLIITDHDDVDYQSIIEHAALIVDTRNACRTNGVRSDKIIMS